MVSKSGLARLVRSFDSAGIRAALSERPDLLDHRDDRGRNWLHLTASISIPDHPELDVDGSVAIAELLIEAGLPIDGPAFVEGTWAATPLWSAVARGRNPRLVGWLLDAGASPEHCLWAAAFRDDEAMLRLLVARGASLEAVAEGETPLLGAVKVSRFRAAAVLLELGADPDFIDAGGMTALHYMLRKGSDAEHVALFACHGARGDIPGPDGRTAAEWLRKKRDPAYRMLAESLAVGPVS